MVASSVRIKEQEPRVDIEDETALLAYAQELEQLATKYRMSSEDLMAHAHADVAQYNQDFERALTLYSRIRILRNA